jgi:hypothetical protein
MVPDDFSSLTKLKVLSLDRLKASTFPRLPRSLKVLLIHGLDSIYPLQFGGYRDSFFDSTRHNDFSALKSLSIQRGDWPCHFARQILETGNIKLEELRLSFMDVSTDDSGLLPDLISSGCIAQATSLELRSCDVTDDIAKMIPKFCINLETLDVSDNKALTQVGVETLLAMAEERKELKEMLF